VGVGDEAGAQAVGAVAGRVEAGAADGGLDQGVDRFGDCRPGGGRRVRCGRRAGWFSTGGRATTSPFGCSARSPTCRAANSLRRNAATNPTSSNARSRIPARSGSTVRVLTSRYG